MRRFSVASLLLLLGGILMLVGLPLQWSSVSATDGTASVSIKGLDEAGFYVITTIVIGVILILSALGVYGMRRWGRVLSILAAVLSCAWAALVYFAVASSNSDAAQLFASSGIKISAGIGPIAIVVGAILALVGAVLGMRGRAVATVPVAPGSPPPL